MLPVYRMQPEHFWLVNAPGFLRVSLQGRAVDCAPLFLVSLGHQPDWAVPGQVVLSWVPPGELALCPMPPGSQAVLLALLWVQQVQRVLEQVVLWQEWRARLPEH